MKYRIRAKYEKKSISEGKVGKKNSLPPMAFRKSGNANVR